MTIVKKNHSAFDVLKIGLSILVVFIHTGLAPEFVFPWVDIAVPLFFMISSYFLFQKLNEAVNEPKVLLGFIKRNLVLYAFWFIVLLPFTLYIRGWFQEGFLPGLARMAWAFLFNGTFRASWYIMALCIGVSLVFLMRKVMKPLMILIITGTVYALCCLCSRYAFLLPESSWLLQAYNWYSDVFLSVGNSWPVSLFWVALGMTFAEKKLPYRNNLNIMLAVCSSLILLGEHLLLLKNGLPFTGCNFLLIPLCISIFAATVNSTMECRCSQNLRKVSTITYCMHGSFATVVSAILYKLGMTGLTAQLATTLVVLGICYGVSAVILRLEQKPAFRWLRFSH